MTLLPTPAVRAGRRALQSWRRGNGALPTSLAGAELCVLVAFLGLRATDIVQLAVSFPTGLGRSTNAGLDITLVAAYVIESAVISTVAFRRRRFASSLWTSVDLAVGVVILAAQPLISAPEDRIGTWTAWGYAVTVGTAFAVGIGFRRRWHTTAATLLLTFIYLAVSLPASLSRGTLTGTVAANAIGYLGFAFFPRALAGFLRRLGHDADAQRRAAQVAGERAERDRQRRLLHDHETVMRMLAQPELDPALAELLRRQAVDGANRVRSFMNPARAGHAPAGTALPDVLRAAAAGFGDLALEFAVTLAADVHLDPATAEAVSDAVVTLLHNVRRHANATSVVIHADSSNGWWEVSIRDDGLGFPTESTPMGFGLRQQVHDNLRAHQVDVEVTSKPGEGTAAVLRGSRDDQVSA